MIRKILTLVFWAVVLLVMLSCTVVSRGSEEFDNSIFPTHTPDPSQLSIDEQPVIATVDTGLADTPPGTVLQIGETWTTAGFSVQLRSVKFCCGDEADLKFTFTNNTGRTLFFHLSKDVHVIMEDNSGKLYTWDTPYEEDLVLENGTSREIIVYKGGNFSGIQYLIITVDLPNLIYAQWKYN